MNDLEKQEFDEAVAEMSQGFELFDKADIAKAFFEAGLAHARSGEAVCADQSMWCDYIAGLICTYLKDGSKQKAIAGIIERRLWNLPASSQPVQEQSGEAVAEATQESFTCPIKGRCQVFKVPGEFLEQGTKLFTHSQPAPESFVGEVVLFGETCKEISWVKGKLPPVGAKLYAQPQSAQTNAQAPGWIRAIDEELVSLNIGIADPNDSYEAAKKKLTDLVQWHVDIATDPAVNGGFSFQPVQPIGWNQAIESVAKMLEAKANAYAQEFGHDDMGGLSFGSGKHAEVKLEHHSTLCELAAEVRLMVNAHSQPAPPDDLPTLVKRLAQALRKAAPDNDLTEKALDYLKRKSLGENILRDDLQPEQHVQHIDTAQIVFTDIKLPDGTPGNRHMFKCPSGENAQVEQPAQEQSDGSADLRQAALIDLAYINGAKAGWNLCVDGDDEKFAALANGVVECVNVLKNTRPDGKAQPPATQINEQLLWAAKNVLDNDGADGSKCYSATKLYDARNQLKNAIKAAESAITAAEAAKEQRQ